MTITVRERDKESSRLQRVREITEREESIGQHRQEESLVIERANRNRVLKKRKRKRENLRELDKAQRKREGLVIESFGEIERLLRKRGSA